VKPNTMNKTNAWMPLWIGDYLSDTQHLTRGEHGAYLLLIMAYWRAGAPLPDDDKRLASIVRAGAQEWKELRPVLAEFFVCADGTWRHKRIDSEIAAAAAHRAQRSAAGRASAAKRNGQRSASEDATGVANPLNVLLPREGNSTPSPSPEVTQGSGNTSTQHAELAIELRRRGVSVTPAHPILAQWLQDGYTPPQIYAALETARLSKPPPAAMPAKYLDAVLRSAQSRPNRHRSIHDERAAHIRALTGQDRNGAGQGKNNPPEGEGIGNTIESTAVELD
jgi:uncharacterized protein YdaU (DUF1376 family)